jgi:putative SOS response-associated peptidase YedK
MCGRFTLTVDPAQLKEAFPWLEAPPELPPSYNIAPSQPVAVIANNNADQVDFFKWGLVPSWAKDSSIGNRMINARAESLVEKPSFRTAFRRRRCLVLADGFYEWQKDPGGKTKIPMYIRMTAQKPFAFAGLWESWNAPDGSLLLSCAIITTSPNPLVASIHDRMPVILSEDAYSLWLDPEERLPTDLQPLLRPYPEEEMIAFPVSRLVNSPHNNLPDCIQPLA